MPESAMFPLSDEQGQINLGGTQTAGSEYLRSEFQTALPVSGISLSFFRFEMCPSGFSRSLPVEFNPILLPYRRFGAESFHERRLVFPSDPGSFEGIVRNSSFPSDRA